MTHWHRLSNNNNNRNNAFSRFRQFIDETLTIIKPWSFLSVKLVLLLLLLLGWFGLPVGVWLRFTEACTDLMSFQGIVFTKWGRKATIYDSKNAGRWIKTFHLVLVAFLLFLFIFPFLLIFYGVEVARLESTTLRHDIRPCSIALIAVECHVKSSSNSNNNKNKETECQTCPLNKCRQTIQG